MEKNKMDEGKNEKKKELGIKDRCELGFEKKKK